MSLFYWRASVASETYIGLVNLDFVAKYIYIPYMVRETHFSSVGPELRNEGGIMCQLLKCFKMEPCASVISMMEPCALVNCLASS